MHEMGLAANVIDMVRAELEKRNIDKSRLTAVKITVGKMMQIVPDSLKFGLEIASRAAGMHNAEFVIKEAPLKVKCGGCGREECMQRGAGGEDFSMACKKCGANNPQITGGREFTIDSIDVAD
ncbi:MAG TPA: hydrogenase maturation nickel metallochaperone HypA [Candidatus Wallbacteria bacterium]|nr:MAG: hydrogenase nickel incorporation protein [bacterium ADurb.Bin243]HPG56427.1 hydrogenase maturation nickel metallochaperone HypA [Candidatus Wallbacteria bacterium]